ncbi:hypothetical protein GIB67_008624 [Kingdonia uniflora]|uniref:K Homology domain-containing protein n=1 Tax=Kingdonia uniflora TaxID=39325 RepID=A0A7J7M4V4_9MAGN|nr:hypothetical protein GIB67_008624 [Kingdonia uniflora]
MTEEIHEEQRSSPSNVDKPEISAKRTRHEEEEESVLPSPKRKATSNNVLFRIVVPSKQIGKIIGKQGSRIQKIREETKATIKIADAIALHEERVIIVSSRDGNSDTSDAENALHHIASVILKEEDSAEPSKIGVVHIAANMIRLLIAGSQAGCIIGKSGQNIEKLRTSTGASVMILAQTQLPLCASAHESDRLVQISGEVPEVLEALKQIGCQLRENAPRNIVSMRPTCNFSPNTLNQSFPSPYPGYLNQSYPTSDSGYLSQSYPASDSGYLNQSYPASDSGYSLFFTVASICNVLIMLHYISIIISINNVLFRTLNLTADRITSEMWILERLVGGLIGKCGSNISKIRNESGAMIKVGGSSYKAPSMIVIFYNDQYAKNRNCKKA